MSTFDQNVSISVAPLESSYTYRVPIEFKDSITVGSRVLVPLGKRTVFGFVVDKADEIRLETVVSAKNYTVKEISTLAFPCACFNAQQLKFFEWISKLYSEPLSSIIELAIPKPVLGKLEVQVRFIKDSEQRLSDAQKILLDYLKQHGQTPLATLSKLTKSGSATIKSLAKRDLLELESKIVSSSDALFPRPISYNPQLPPLNESQYQIVEELKAAVSSHRFATRLIHGVTGSGKTEVYAHLIVEAVTQGYGALILVPEIALTPQLVERIETRLGGPIAVLHSGLPARERWAAWDALLEGKLTVALGARSSLFAPVKNLGLIIVDEEHDGSFKQNEGFRYNARDLAVARGKLESCPVVLGSATPSLESYWNTQSGNYSLSTIARKHNTGPSVPVEIVDMSKLRSSELPSPSISPILHAHIEETLKRGTQAFILYNRRGFATYLQCSHCEAVVSCPQCSVTLTYHQGRNLLLCHYCGHAGVPPVSCVSCKATKLDGLFVQRGAGTERVHEELKELFPLAQIARLDRDVASNLESYRRVLHAVKSGETNILVGTQMIAKGHDLPLVTLVGVVDCDVGLHMPDFRAGERVFQLLTQAAGRAGRRELASAVVLQTRSPRHPSVVYAMSGDTLGFMNWELQVRKALSYPPFVRILRILCSSPDQHLAEKSIENLKESLQSLKVISSSQVIVLGPVAAPLSRLRNEWRFHIICKSQKVSQLLSVLAAGKSLCKAMRNVKFVFDLDPQEMM